MSTKTCSDCGAPLADAGVCQNCLLQLGLESSSEPDKSALPEELADYLEGYTLLEELGRGGMGIVYRAHQEALKRDVALKVMTSGALAAPAVAERFRTEAEAAGAMDHPNIVTVYEVGECDGQQFLSMQLVEGGTLANLLAAKKPTGETLSARVDLVIKMARAVAYAHQRGILHRDIKPANILLDEEGEPYLSDFGLAKLVEDQGDLTQTMAVMGTPAYMSPEQAQGKTKTLTTAADVYALGVVLYELISGIAPFEGNSTVEVLRRLVETEPRKPSAHNAEVDRDLETICLKCLEKSPEKRYPSALALAEDLERWRSGHPIEARMITPLERSLKWMRRRPVAAALIVVSLISVITIAVGTALFNLQLQEKNSAITEANSKITEQAEERRQSLIRLTEDTGLRHYEDGDYFAALPWFLSSLKLEAGDEEREDLFRRRIGMALRSSPKLIHVWRPETPPGNSLFSPDGSLVLILPDKGATAGLYRTSTGEAVHSLPIKEGTISSAAFSNDGKMLALGAAHRERGGWAQLYDVSRGTPIANRLEHEAEVFYVAFTPDSDRLLTTSANGVAKIWNCSNGEVLRSHAHESGVSEAAALDPTGEYLAIGGELGSIVGWKVEDGEEAFRITTQQKDRLRSLAFSRSGESLVAQVGTQAEVFDMATKESRSEARFHNSGRWLYSTHFQAGLLATAGRDGTATIWNIATGRKLFPRLEHSHGVRQVQFSPDGRSVLTASDDRTAVLWRASDGKQISPPLWNHGPIRDAQFSRNGSMVVTTSPSEVRLWSLVTTLRAGPNILASKRTHRASFQGNSLLTSDYHNEVFRWDYQTGLKLGDVSKVDPSTLDPNPFLRPTPPLRNTTGTREARIKDHEVFLQNPENGRALPHPLTHTEAVTVMRFLNEDRWLFTGGEGRAARIWDAQTGKPITPWLGHESTIVNGTLHPKNTHLATFSNGHFVSTWDLRPDERSLAELEKLSTLLTGQRLDPQRGPVPTDDLPTLSPLAHSSLPTDLQYDAWVINESHDAWIWMGPEWAKNVVESSSRPEKLNFARANLATVLRDGNTMFGAYSQLAKENPDDPAILELAAGYLKALNQLAPAAALYQKVVQLDPSRAGAHFGLAMSDVKATWEQAAANTERAVKQNPHSASMLDYHAENLGGLKRWDEAFAHFERAAASRRKILQLDGGEPFAHPYPKRSPDTPPTAIDLGKFYNNPPGHFVHFDKIPGKQLSDAPWGRIEVDGITFDMRGAIRLAPLLNYRITPLPQRALGIPIRRKCTHLHLLHTVKGVLEPDTVYLDFHTTYADGTRKVLRFRYDHQARDCYYAPELPLKNPTSKIAWHAGQAPDKGNPTIYLSTWKNPKPDVELMFLNANLKGRAEFLLFAVTAE